MKNSNAQPASFAHGSSQSVLCAAMLWLLLTVHVFAGASVRWEEALTKIAKDDPDLAQLVQVQFDVADIGNGVWVGHDKDGNSLAPPYEVGERIPPYDFDAKPKGTDGGLTLRLSFEPTSIVLGKVNRWQMTLIVTAKPPST